MDRLLLMTQLSLGALGVLGVATSAPEAWPGQLLRVAIGLALTVAVAHIPPKFVVRLSPYAYVSVLGLLLITLFFGISPAGSESKRWLLIAGFTLQPSELMKVVVIAYLTAFFHNHLGDWQIWRPMVVIGLAAGLIIAEPDLSTALFIFALAFAIMLAAGITMTRLVSISAAAVLIAAPFAMPYLSQFDYIGDRIVGFMDMRGDQALNDSVSYQASRAQTTLVRAGFFGIGPGRGVSVPEADTDMVAIAIAHALGLSGTLSLFVLYFVLAGRGMRVAASLKGPGSLLAAGATAYVCGQAAMNLLVASGVIPVTGIPLPFVSYGLNSLVSVSIAMGFIHSAYRQAVLEGVAV